MDTTFPDIPDVPDLSANSDLTDAPLNGLDSNSDLFSKAFGLLTTAADYAIQRDQNRADLKKSLALQDRELQAQAQASQASKFNFGSGTIWLVIGALVLLFFAVRR